jgi:twinkle protein
MKREEYEESEYLHKTNCESCGSSDANAVYANGNTHCFSCNKTVFANNVGSKPMEDRRDTLPVDLLEVDIRELSKRGISRETCAKFNYGYAKGKQVATYYDTDGRAVGQKLRSPSKDFSWIGNAKKATLFGQNIWAPHPKKRIVLTEGEIDALTVSQVQENKWAVVSVPNGAASAERDVRKSLEYLSGFKEVVICFDMDEVGQEAARKVAALLPPNKALIATLPLKDANEMLTAGRSAELIQCLWDAKRYRPDGILTGLDILDRMNQVKTNNSIPMPDFMPKVNQKTKGIRLGELDVFTSGTGMGKSSLIKQIQYHIFETTEYNQGMLHLEEPLEFTAKSMVGLALKTRLHLDHFIPQETIDSKAQEIFLAVDHLDFNRVNLYDAFGSVQEDDLYDKIRFMVKGMGCQIIWLDHLSILVSSLSQDNDERRTIDRIMHNLKSLTQELGCYIGLIVHLNNATTGKTFEEGGVPNLNNLRGSGGIKQLSDTVYAVSRNQQAESETERNTALVTVLKCRFTGDTGPADYIYYNNTTGCFEAAVEPTEGEVVDLSDFA